MPEATSTLPVPEAFHVRGALQALGRQTGLGIITEMISHGRAGGAAVRHEVHDGTAISRLILHGFKFFRGRGEIEIGHFDRAALDLHRDEQRFPVAGSCGLGSVHVFAGFVDFHIFHGADLDLAVVVLIGDQGRGTGVSGPAVVAGFGGLCAARAEREHHDEREHKGKGLFHVLFSFNFLFTGIAI